MANLISGSKKGRAAKWIFIGGLAVLLLTGVTPLEFKYPLLAWLTVAFVFAFSVSKNLAKSISIRWIRRTIINIPNTVLFLIIVTLIATFPFSIMSLWNSQGAIRRFGLSTEKRMIRKHM
jgi:glycerol-3-phosphate acyltransferase PlsY